MLSANGKTRTGIHTPAAHVCSGGLLFVRFSSLREVESGASLVCLYGCCFLFFPPIFLGVGEQVEIQEFLNTSNAHSKGGVADLFKDPRVSTERQMQCKQFAKLCACGWRGTSHRACGDYP